MFSCIYAFSGLHKPLSGIEHLKRYTFLLTLLQLPPVQIFILATTSTSLLLFFIFIFTFLFPTYLSTFCVVVRVPVCCRLCISDQCESERKKKRERKKETKNCIYPLIYEFVQQVRESIFSYFVKINVALDCMK